METPSPRSRIDDPLPILVAPACRADEVPRHFYYFRGKKGNLQILNTIFTVFRQTNIIAFAGFMIDRLPSLNFAATAREGAGALALAGLLKCPGAFRERKVVLVVSGKNIADSLFQEIVGR